MTEQTIYLTQHELEERWQLNGRTLERWRVEKYGPPWYVLGGTIRYRRDEVEAFEARQRRGSPSRPHGGDTGGGAP